MLAEIKQLSDLRKYYLIYQFFTKATNIFLVAITISLLSTMFGDVGLTLNAYAPPMLGLLIFTPFISGYIVDNPQKCFSWIIAIEALSLGGYCIAEMGFYPEVSFITGLVCITVANVFVSPLRVKNTSQVIAGDKNYAILSERINSVFIVVVSGVGIVLLLQEMTTYINIALTMTCMLASRFTYVRVLAELEKMRVESKKEK